ncbi:hypothetical protein BH23ACI1_BH23ACI1_06770 [soil metagenome]
MTTLLILVTVVSLAMTTGLFLLVVKLRREERLRSDARVAALLEWSADPAAERPAAARIGAQGPPWDGLHVTPVPARVAADRRTVDLPLRTAPPVSELFAQHQRGASWGPRIAVAAGALAVLAGIAFTALPGPATPDRGTLAATAAPLQLLTLRHAPGAGTLTVSGIVQNPNSGVPRRHVVATASALAEDGSVLATARAPIDIAAFGLGEESPFIVAIPVSGAAGAVARYRIGFRAQDGSVIAHVDRRAGTEPLAQK